MATTIVTIGVYGFDEQSFFGALQDAKIDTFCDIRLRRGMRGSLYAFANSEYLQRRLRKLEIRYLHLKELLIFSRVRTCIHHELVEAFAPVLCDSEGAQWAITSRLFGAFG